MNSLANSIRKFPFVRILIPLVAGIVVAHYFTASWWALGGALAGSYLMAWIGIQRRESWFYVTAAIALTGMALGQFYRTPDPLPKGERLLLTFQIRETPSVSGRWARTSADVGAFRRESDPPGAWNFSPTKILLWIDTCYRIEAGAQYAALVYVNPIDTTAGSGYTALMHKRGYSGKSFITPGRLLTRAHYESRTPSHYVRGIHTGAARRLDRLDLSPKAHSIVTAMTIGEKREMARDLRAAYSRSGAAHLLAVSGLHVGIVFSLVNLLLYLLPAIRKGHIWKNVLAIAAIWGYAAVAGLSPSVIRAAFMFTGAQVALAATQHRNSLNIILGTAVVMLAFDPNYLFDISFQLSFVAVLMISAAFWPLFARMRTRYSLLNAFTSVVIIGVVATFGTAPLVSHQFGNFPILGIVINPVVIFMAHLIVMFSVFWILLPIEPLKALFSWLLEFFVGIQNAIVEGCAMISWVSYGIRIPLWSLWACYLVYLVLLLWWHDRALRTRKSFAFTEPV